ncbi:MAG TPA: SIMPL domain-containing protein [Rhizomicrobium sp.]|nr:SIMPL domain-containing protein [Rhizomicrobium sp.]
MKTWIVSALALALLMPGMAAAQEQHVITMSGHGETHGKPDTAMLSAGVSMDAPTAAAALAAANKEMQAMLAALKSLGVPDKDIQTRNFSVRPQYATGNGEAPRVTGYQVMNQVEVRLQDIGKLGPTLDALVSAGANQVNGVNLSLHDSTALLAEARTAAVADARAKAETFAKAAGVTLGSILSIQENGRDGPRPVVFAAPMARAASVPVALGEETIAADVTITWEIK